MADLIRVGYLPRVWLPPEQIRQLRKLVRYRSQLVDDRRRLKLRVRAILRDERVTAPPRIRPWTLAWLAWLRQETELADISRRIVRRQLDRIGDFTREIREVERELHQWAEEDRLCLRLMEMDGIGLITAITLRAEVGQFDRFSSGKQLARFCGLSPRNASSGSRQSDSGLIKAGNPQLRCILIEAAHRLMRRNVRWLTFARRLRKKGKPTNVIVAAVASRWVRWLYHQMQPGQLAC